MFNRIWKVGVNHPILAHMTVYLLLSIALGLVELCTSESISFFSFVIPAVCFLGWLFESYYKITSKKLWIIYFSIMLIFLAVFDRDSWSDLGTSIMQIGLAAVVVTISILLGRKS
ncbi:hypothetical protein [Enterococcus gilvus]|uniref:hypothetical protein n=1 Tax=Enterococcus gilvus TaxID=160453 RepID=UPI0029148098|nr:hypothetical protein [Enterococcus gilvus]MDU5511935.1 hypothetical protein [Enterococcus gilvus]